MFLQLAGVGVVLMTVNKCLFDRLRSRLETVEFITTATLSSRELGQAPSRPTSAGVTAMQLYTRLSTLQKAQVTRLAPGP